MLRALVIVPLVAGALAVGKPAQADPYYTTTPPEGCYLYEYVHQGFLFGVRTYCTRMHGLHRAVVRCSDGNLIYGYTEEMDYNLMSLAECRERPYDWSSKPIPAVEAWGEYWPDY
jgi:hypothetical protein